MTLTAVAAALFALAAGEAEAQAQTRFGDKGQLAITAENLFSFSSDRYTEAFPNGDVKDTTSRFGFLLSDHALTDRAGGFTTHIPLVGGHYFLAPSISIGGNIGYESRGGSFSTAGNPAVSTDKVSISTFMLAPKVGYALPLTPALGFWFRGGLGFLRQGVTNAVDSRIKDSFSFWFLSLDAFFVVSPVQHFAFYVGPQGDFTLGGSHSASGPAPGGGGAIIEGSQSAWLRSLGIGTGLIGYFDL